MCHVKWLEIKLGEFKVDQRYSANPESLKK